MCRAMADAVAAMDQVLGPLALMNALLAPDRQLAAENREVESLRRTARAAFEDWYEARVRAQITEGRGQACSDVRAPQGVS